MNSSAEVLELNALDERPTSVPKPRVAYVSMEYLIVAAMAIVTAALFWYPLARINVAPEVNYNEGWNSYKQAMAAAHQPFYVERPGHFTGGTGYPPVSFHLVAWLAPHQSYTLTGRWVSLLALLASGIFIALTVRRSGGSARISTFSGLLYIIGISLLLPDRLGMNDPQLLGEALCSAGLLAYVWKPEKRSLLWLSAVLFCLAGFTKQNLVAFPIAVGIDLLIRSRKNFAVWSAAMIASAGILATIVTAVDGKHFIEHLLLVRAYSYRFAWHDMFRPYMATFQGPVLLAAVASLCIFPRRLLFVLAFGITHVVAFFLSGADGVDLNMWFNAVASVALVSGVALTELAAVTDLSPAGASTNKLSVAVAAALFVTLLIQVPGQLQGNREQRDFLKIRESDFRTAAQFVRTQPGPALCESLLLCYAAGKSYEYDPLFVRDQVLIGRLQQVEIDTLLRNRYFQSIQIMITPWEAKHPDQLKAGDRLHFSRAFMETLLSHYHVAMHTSQMMLFTPNE